MAADVLAKNQASDKMGNKQTNKANAGNRGTLDSGMTVLIALILIIAVLVIYFVFYKNLGEGGNIITSGITSNLTGLLAG